MSASPCPSPVEHKGYVTERCSTSPKRLCMVTLCRACIDTWEGINKHHIIGNGKQDRRSPPVSSRLCSRHPAHWPVTCARGCALRGGGVVRGWHQNFPPYHWICFAAVEGVVLVGW